MRWRRAGRPLADAAAGPPDQIGRAGRRGMRRAWASAGSAMSTACVAGHLMGSAAHPETHMRAAPCRAHAAAA